MSLEDLERRVAALEAAAASAPPPDDQRLAYLTSWLCNYIGDSPLHRDDAKGLARELLANRILAGAPAPWPELPAEVPDSWIANNCSDDYRIGRNSGWAHARDTLAAMNPNRQQEDQGNG